MLNMSMSDKGKAFLTCREGICLTPYLDSVGVKTIAIGATKTEIPDLASWSWDREITLPQAFALMDKSLDKYENPLNRYLTRNIPQYMFDALTSWCYNCGPGWVPKATVIKLINAGASKDLIYRALMMYTTPKEITSRRQKEAVLLTTGNYGDLTKADLFATNQRTHKPIYGKKSINPMAYINNTEVKEAVIEHPDKVIIKAAEAEPIIVAKYGPDDDLLFVKDKIGELYHADLDWVKIAKAGLGIA